MGGICGKPSGVDDNRRSPRVSSKVSSESRGSQSKRVESFRVKNRAEVRTGSIDKRLNSSRRVRDDHYEKKWEVSKAYVANISGIGTIPKAIEGEQVVAGCPSWLAAMAGEAINGWLPRRADTFEKLDKAESRGGHSVLWWKCTKSFLERDLIGIISWANMLLAKSSSFSLWCRNNSWWRLGRALFTWSLEEAWNKFNSKER